MVVVFTTAEAGEKVAINPNHVVSVMAQVRVAPVKQAYTGIWIVGDEKCTKVRESFDEVVRMLNGQAS